MTRKNRLEQIKREQTRGTEDPDQQQLFNNNKIGENRSKFRDNHILTVSPENMAAREAPGVKTFQLKRKAGVGFGIALSGGAGQQPAPNQHDQGIYGMVQENMVSKESWKRFKTPLKTPPKTPPKNAS